MDVQHKATDYPLGTLLRDVPFTDYLNAPGMSSSGLKLITRSPAHYRAARDELEDEESDALEFGSLLHLAVLEPDTYFRHRMVRPKFDGRTKVGKAGLAEWEACLPAGAVEVREEWDEKLTRMAERIYEHPVASPLLQTGIREGTFFWLDPATGVRCKGRPDFLSHNKRVFVDLKTAKDARPDAFSRAAWQYRYDVQAAHYCAGAEATGIARPDMFAFLVQEKEPPFEVMVYTCGLSVLGVGSQWRQDALMRYAGCLESGMWPGYTTTAQVLELPSWAKGVDDAAG